MPRRRKTSIDRAETWLHLTFGGSPALRISANTTSMPREARSIAAVNPTGPAPTTRTWVCVLCITSLGWPVRPSLAVLTGICKDVRQIKNNGEGGEGGRATFALGDGSIIAPEFLKLPSCRPIAFKTAPD